MESCRAASRKSSPSAFEAFWLYAPSMLLSPSAQMSVNGKSWRIILILSRGYDLRNVEAPSHETAEIAAAEKFALSPEERKRIVVQERR
jgi:hypothetical protein